MQRSGIGMTGVTRYGSRPLMAVHSSSTGNEASGRLCRYQTIKSQSAGLWPCAAKFSVSISNSMRTRAALACVPLSVLLAIIAA
jgi:hypothetical protein